MFTPFFYLLRAHGLNITTHEWLTFLEGLRDGLHHATLNGFYQLGLATLCKSESDYDRFQQAFSEYFYDAEVHTATGEIQSEITQEMLNWLNDPKVLYERFTRDDVTEEMLNRTQEEIERMLRERLKEQRREHNGGKYWVGTHGISPFGNNGYNPNGIRVGGVSRDRAALRVAGERTYRDFRDDNMLDIRQFQMAFRRLCHYSDQAGQEEEFDVARTIHDTCQKAGILQIRYKKPRAPTPSRSCCSSTPAAPWTTTANCAVAVSGGQPFQPVQGTAGILLSQLSQSVFIHQSYFGEKVPSIDGNGSAQLRQGLQGVALRRCHDGY